MATNLMETIRKNKGCFSEISKDGIPKIQEYENLSFVAILDNNTSIKNE